MPQLTTTPPNCLMLHSHAYDNGYIKIHTYIPLPGSTCHRQSLRMSGETASLSLENMTASDNYPTNILSTLTHSRSRRGSKLFNCISHFVRDRQRQILFVYVGIFFTTIFYFLFTFLICLRHKVIQQEHEGKRRIEKIQSLDTHHR